jgi:acyl-CoA synthetase (NDP forming)
MPVLTVVGARSPAGHRAASHTTAAATPLINQEAMFDLAGVIATTSLGELVDTAALLACQPLPAGNRVAIIANAGGAGALAADAWRRPRPAGRAVRRGHAARAGKLLPAPAVVTGPVDTTPVVTTDTFRACVEEVAADDGVDAVLAVAVPTAFSDLSAAVAERSSASRSLSPCSTGPSPCDGSSACPSHCRRPAQRRTPAQRATPQPPTQRPPTQRPQVRRRQS